MRRPDGSTISFLDIVLNTCLCFILLFTIALAHMSLKRTEADIRKPKAEFLVEVQWNGDRNADVDSWLQTPNGDVLYFRKKMNEYAHIDHDDLGDSTDAVRLADGTLQVNPRNQEIITFRQASAGEWVVNVHLYRKDDDFRPVEVDVRILKLNPSVTEVAHRVIELRNMWDERTVARLTMDAQGNIVAQSELQKPLVMSVAAPATPVAAQEGSVAW